MRKHLFVSILGLVSFLVTTNSYSQGSRLKLNRSYSGYNSIGTIRYIAGIGSSIYYGDLHTGFGDQKYRPAFSLGINYRFHPFFAVRAEGSYFRLYGTDEGGKNEHRNLKFRSGNLSLETTLIVDVLEQRKTDPWAFSPYAFAGIGFMYFNPANNGQLGADDWKNLSEINTEGEEYSNFTPTIPFGVGVRYRVNDQIHLVFEAGYRITFTDYLDDVSTEFPEDLEPGDPNFEIIDPSPEQISQDFPKRGNPDANDGYAVFMLKIEYQRPQFRFKRKTPRRFRRK